MAPGPKRFVQTFSPMGNVSAISSTQKLMMAVGTAAGAYHGYKRNKSALWAIIWATLGGFAPLITGAVMIAQGFGKEKHD